MLDSYIRRGGSRSLILGFRMGQNKQVITTTTSTGLRTILRVILTI
jgi:hypothetical protein